MWLHWNKSRKFIVILSIEKLSQRIKWRFFDDGHSDWCENVNLYSHYGEQHGDSYKKLGINLPYDPATPLLGLYPEKTTTLKDTCTPVILAAVFIIDWTWKQPRCPSIDEWIKKLWYIYKWNITQPQKGTNLNQLN